MLQFREKNETGYVYNLSCSGGWDRKILSLRPAEAIYQDPVSKFKKGAGNILCFLGSVASMSRRGRGK